MSLTTHDLARRRNALAQVYKMTAGLPPDDVRLTDEIPTLMGDSIGTPYGRMIKLSLVVGLAVHHDGSQEPEVIPARAGQGPQLFDGLGQCELTLNIGTSVAFTFLPCVSLRAIENLSRIVAGAKPSFEREDFTFRRRWWPLEIDRILRLTEVKS